MLKKSIYIFLILLIICIPDIIFRLPVPKCVLSSSELINITFYISRMFFWGLAVFFGDSLIKE